MQLNHKGVDICERHAVIFLRKILQGYAENYMELRSPCGATVGQMAYFYDGNVFTCDEGRMLYEMGNDAFKLLKKSTITHKFNEYTKIQRL